MGIVDGCLALLVLLSSWQDALAVWDLPVEYFMAKSPYDTCQEVPDNVRNAVNPFGDTCLGMEAGTENCICHKRPFGQLLSKRLEALVEQSGILFDPNSDAIVIDELPLHQFNEETLYRRECGVCLTGIGGGEYVQRFTTEYRQHLRQMVNAPLAQGIIKRLHLLERASKGSDDDFATWILSQQGSPLTWPDYIGGEPLENVAFGEIPAFGVPFVPSYVPDCTAVDFNSTASLTTIDGVCRDAEPYSKVCVCSLPGLTNVDAMRMMYLTALIGHENSRHDAIELDWIKMVGYDLETGILGSCGHCAVATNGDTSRFMVEFGPDFASQYAKAMLMRPIVTNLRFNLDRLRIWLDSRQQQEN